jgi:hypothetical protein
MTDERKAQHQLQLASEAFHRGDQRASLEAYTKAFLAAPPRWEHRYYSFAGACSLLEGEDVAEESTNVKSNDRDMVFLKVVAMATSIIHSMLHVTFSSGHLQGRPRVAFNSCSRGVYTRLVQVKC